MKDMSKVEEFRNVMFKWSKKSGKILKEEEIKLFGAGYFAALEAVQEELKDMESGRAADNAHQDYLRDNCNDKVKR